MEMRDDAQLHAKFSASTSRLYAKLQPIILFVVSQQHAPRMLQATGN